MNFIGRIPVLHSHWDTKLLHLSSLREVSIVDAFSSSATTPIPVTIEPTFLALGPQHIAVGMNNRCWFYALGSRVTQLCEREYVGTVSKIVINDTWAAALCDGCAQLHKINDPANEELRVFPEKDGAEKNITSIAITNDYFIYTTSEGVLVYWLLSHGKVVNEYRHMVGLKKVYPNKAGTRSLVVDAAQSAFVVNPVNDIATEIQGFPASADSVLWDNIDRGVFVVSDVRTFIPFVYRPSSIDGPTVSHLKPTKRPLGFSPVLSCAG